MRRILILGLALLAILGASSSQAEVLYAYDDSVPGVTVVDPLTLQRLSVLANVSKGTEIGVIDPVGRRLFMFTHGALLLDLTGFVVIDLATGVLTPKTLTRNVELRDVGYDTVNGLMYGSDGFTGDLVSINPSTAAVTTLVPFLGATSVAVNTVCRCVYGLGNFKIFTVLLTNNQVTQANLPHNFTSIQFDPVRLKIYATDANTRTFSSIDPGTGASPVLATLPNSGVFESSPLLYGPASQTLYSVAFYNGQPPAVGSRSTIFNPSNNGITVGSGNPRALSLSPLALDGFSPGFIPAISPGILFALAAALAAMALFRLR